MSEDVSILRAEGIQLVRTFFAILSVEQFVHFTGIATHLVFSPDGEWTLAKAIFGDELDVFEHELRFEALKTEVLSTPRVYTSLKQDWLASRRFVLLGSDAVLEHSKDEWKEYHQRVEEAFRA